ncbi:zinc-dependent alcohol dehydrogenase family protein [Gluconobacter kanchanaburiensis]|uniref:NADPH:quinone reductase n=1 Tax=Gluconobacter kanchanaburiensis NBRC 103587 TaxID=1307948 RepID=A0A511B3Y1_9PROT|nr:zinc-dependent alcohol dehydrogenase family protein [Gluconobacter kanchanaburiensis]MBF0861520.1 zinc-dependent alcohol dehydrogenase family protein [Gluconobacter kanchanaburiensis]GBR66894.1 NADPH:quinone reductase [Gluconobacter kanchanaburiensis NBRC 103587]GEK95156.1 NADPH:quinone reductase [Gluconobacter kanchanaburiensis NBRC 103587]
MARTVIFNKTGGPEVLEVVDKDVPAPKAGEVQIRVKAMGLNRAEVMFRTGNYVTEPRFPAIIGYEASGLIEALGPDVSGFAVGDAVSVIPCFMLGEYGLHGELVNAPAFGVVKNPPNVSWEEAAATWMMFTTAYGALVDIGQLAKGDTVLIRAASSSVGLAAIQIVNMLGGTPIALTRHSNKSEELLQHGAKHVIATEEQDLVKEVGKITNGKGARLAFDPVGGPYVATILEALSDLGVFFQYGALDTTPLAVPVMSLLGKDLTVRGYQLFEITRDQERLERAKAFISKGLADDLLKPVIAKVFKLEDISEAHRFMESNAQIGKIVVVP